MVLLVLDGWGYRAESDGNAIAMASTPTWDALMARHPHTLLEASGLAVGLPCGQMGNSEVGHLNLGAGRVVPQDLVRIDESLGIKDYQRANWYLDHDRRWSAITLYRRLVHDHPHTAAARSALQQLARLNVAVAPVLPATTVPQAPASSAPTTGAIRETLP